MSSSIIVRPWQREDAQQLAAITNNRNIWNNLRDQLPFPYTVMDAMQWITLCQQQDPVVNFAVVYNGKIAGSIGCVPKNDVYRKSIEIGYFIGESFWGKGIATTAVQQLVQYVLQRFDVVRIFAEVFEHNLASMRVLQKNGFYLEGIHRKAVVKNNQVMDAYIWVKMAEKK